jgi:hypothetical protein
MYLSREGGEVWKFVPEGPGTGAILSAFHQKPNEEYSV